MNKDKEKALAKKDGPTELEIADWQTMKEQANMLVKSGFLPKAINTPEKAIAVMLTGHELRVPAMQAFRSIHVIDGKPGISAELMAALINRHIMEHPIQLARAYFTCTETSNEVATYETWRPGMKAAFALSFTLEEAKTAGLLGKDNWKKYGPAMLRSRACSAAARVIWADAIMGFHTAEELGAVTDADGEPLEVDAEVTDTPQGGEKESPPSSETDPRPELVAKIVKAEKWLVKHSVKDGETLFDIGVWRKRYFGGADFGADLPAGGLQTYHDELERIFKGHDLQDNGEKT